MNTRRISLLAGALIVLAGVLASPATALDPLYTVQVAKQKSGDYDRYDTVTLDVGDKRTLYWKVANKTEEDYKVDFNDAATENPNPAGFKVKWFRGDKEITDEVKNGNGYRFKLLEGEKEFFHATIKRTDEMSDENVCLGGQGAMAPEPYYAETAYFGVNGECI